MHISLIVAASENDVIGRKNALPWKLPDDLQYFRDLTLGKTVIMGRKTYESIGKPLPKRRNVVISTTQKSIPGCDVYASLADALLALDREKNDEEVFIIGGRRLFEESLLEILSHLRPQKIYLTRVHATIDGDVFLPTINWEHWKKVSSVPHAKNGRHEFAFTFEVYERKER